ncbi:MAG: hypothetical protein ABGX20_11265 [Bacillus sp. (in: firmicutes)]
MLFFIGGLLMGSFTMLFIMSLMVAAKRGDQQLEAFYQDKAY